MVENPQSDPPIHYFSGMDGVRLAYREVGTGRPLVLIHGYFSNATVNWLRYGHAVRIAASGYRVVMPDLRAHGDSAKPHDAAAYPPDVLADDAFALISHLALTDYDLGGYSLGARTLIRLLARGASPGRAIVAGMGLQGVLHTAERSAFFRRVLSNSGSFPRGSPEWMAEAFLKTSKGDPSALLRVLDTFVDTSREALAEINVPMLVVAGAEDNDNGSAEELAKVFRHAEYATVPGNHMSAVTMPALGAAFAAFLGLGS
ncbi:MAG: alpha/beta hydrolase [Pseudomonadota bacterium]|nr:alpha/beta hydrolase [Pseudomonadota bacterium]